MRKTVVYIAILGILGFGVWYFLFKDNSLFTEEEAGFNIPNTNKIGKVFLVGQKGDSISLVKNGDNWVLNGKYRTSPRMIEILLQTFKEQTAAYPVPEVTHNTVIKDMAGTAVKVEVFDVKGGKMKTFFVGGQVSGNKGTYMLIEGAQRPYVVQLPAYQGYITPRYSTDLLDWRDRTWINIPANQLASVSVQYADSNEYLNSFSFVRQGDTFAVKLPPALSSMEIKLNKKRVKTYAGFFEQVGFEGYLDGVAYLDSIIADVPKYCDVIIADINGKESNVSVYRMRVNKRSKNVSDEAIPEFDGDRYYGIINHKDTVILQSVTFDKMFRKGYEFYEADNE